MKWSHSRLALATVAGLVVACASAWAVDGVVEISQAKVLAGGGHFPYVISSSGSYRLTGNLDVTNDPGNATTAQNRTAISITAGRVTLDLNGFSIVGGTSCTGTTTVCTPSGSGDGVNSTQADVVVRNGAIQGMGDDGVDLSSGVVEDIQAVGNGGIGISLSNSGQVRRSQVRGNGSGGISVFSGSVTSCVASQANAFSAITCSGIIKGNVVSQGGTGTAVVCSQQGMIANNRVVAEQMALSAGLSTVIGNYLYRLSGSPTANLSSSGYTGNFFQGDSPFVSGGLNHGANTCFGFVASECP